MRRVALSDTATPGAVTLYSVGHSNRSAEALLEVLRRAGIRTLVDVRAYPHSQRFPHFDADALRAALEAAAITYHWAGRQLGGRRRPAAVSRHIALPDDGLRGYADYMETDSFARAATQLVNLAGQAPTVIMCAERLPEQCHRSLLADYLTLQGHRVMHLLEPGEVREHRLSAQARRESLQLIYDRQATGVLDLS